MRTIKFSVGIATFLKPSWFTILICCNVCTVVTFVFLTIFLLIGWRTVNIHYSLFFISLDMFHFGSIELVVCVVHFDIATDGPGSGISRTCLVFSYRSIASFNVVCFQIIPSTIVLFGNGNNFVRIVVPFIRLKLSKTRGRVSLFAFTFRSSVYGYF
uniref:Uncharacterized protein n=1 Tax=Cacopsylla melanoneura TaxID=428564 RepID=A0A8D9E935_9HEMI